MNKKDRRNSGRVDVVVPKGMEEFSFEYYDDWKDYREGFRDTRDKTKIRKRNSRGFFQKEDKIKQQNNKLKRLLRIREVRKSE